jgi:hypothetical protein
LKRTYRTVLGPVSSGTRLMRVLPCRKVGLTRTRDRAKLLIDTPGFVFKDRLKPDLPR